MANLEDMNRILYQHEWNNLEEWVESLSGLALLSDEDIGRLCASTPGNEYDEI